MAKFGSIPNEYKNNIDYINANMADDIQINEKNMPEIMEYGLQLCELLEPKMSKSWILSTDGEKIKFIDMSYILSEIMELTDGTVLNASYNNINMFKLVMELGSMESDTPWIDNIKSMFILEQSLDAYNEMFIPLVILDELGDVHLIEYLVKNLEDNRRNIEYYYQKLDTDVAYMSKRPGESHLYFLKKNGDQFIRLFFNELNLESEQEDKISDTKMATPLSLPIPVGKLEGTFLGIEVMKLIKSYQITLVGIVLPQGNTSKNEANALTTKKVPNERRYPLIDSAILFKNATIDYDNIGAGDFYIKQCVVTYSFIFFLDLNGNIAFCESDRALQIKNYNDLIEHLILLKHDKGPIDKMFFHEYPSRLKSLSDYEQRDKRRLESLNTSFLFFITKGGEICEIPDLLDLPNAVWRRYLKLDLPIKDIKETKHFPLVTSNLMTKAAKNKKLKFKNMFFCERLNMFILKDIGDNIYTVFNGNDGNYIMVYLENMNIESIENHMERNKKKSARK